MDTRVLIFRNDTVLYKQIWKTAVGTLLCSGLIIFLLMDN